MAIHIKPVLTRADQRAFYRFAFQVYRNDPCWVPHLWPQRKSYLDRKAAFFSYGEGDFWLAVEDGTVVGTIGTAMDHSRNAAQKLKLAEFGFFEVLPERYDVAAALWNLACDWGRARNASELVGPYSFAANDDQGFLIEGFATQPAIMMGHNPEYYPRFAERYGFRKSELGDWVAYRFDFSSIDYDVKNAPAVVHRIAARCRARHGSAVIRTARMADWEREIPALHAVYNTSLAVLPEFVPMELAEFKAQAESLRSVMDPELVFIAEMDGKVVGFALGLPNISEALQAAGGLQSPLDYARFLWARRRIRSASFKILAIDPQYWGYGLEALMFLEMGRAMLRKGYRWADASLTDEFNPQTNKLATRAGAYVYRRYREYRLTL